MLAFAGNSLLTRMALRDGAIDAASFTSIRLASGAVALLLLFRLLRSGATSRGHGGWWSAFALFAYAIAFSLAYLSLSAGAGALILFGFVQATMIVSGLRGGERRSPAQWSGWLIAFAGMVWLLAPGIEAPSPGGAVLMALAGIAWGVYSIRGRHESDAFAATTTNFLLSLAFVAGLTLLTFDGAELGMRGVLLAVVSGAITSGAGYVVWYAALERLATLQAALVQLSVPAIAALGGVVFLAEPLTMRLLLASLAVLGGIALSLGAGRRD